MFFVCLLNLRFFGKYFDRGQPPVPPTDPYNRNYGDPKNYYGSRSGYEDRNWYYQPDTRYDTRNR